MSARLSPLHNPALLPGQTLLDEFTARGDILRRILDIMRCNRPGSPPQNLLLIGPRGMGKSTMLWATAHSINLSEGELRKEWQPVVFDEESRRIGDLADFWLECISQWNASMGQPQHDIDELLDMGAEDVERSAREKFLGLLADNNLRAALLIDNIDSIFSNINDPHAEHRLRAFLMESDRVMIIGAAPAPFPGVLDMDRPFYDYFRIFDLKPLTFEETKKCLIELAGRRGDEKILKILENATGRLRAIHLLTGGNPRLLKTFYRLLGEGLQRDTREELEALLDEFTPYFKAIVDNLSAQQQKIFDAIALAWDPVEVAKISRQVRLPSNQVSAQIRSMVHGGLLSEIRISPKKKCYLLADRFSNIHYLMRHGRIARARFDWFVAMARLLFEDEEFAKSIATMAKESALCGESGWSDACDLVANAVQRAENPAARKHLLDKLAQARETDTVDELRLLETASRSILASNPEDAHAHYKLGRVFELLHGDYKNAALKYEKACEIDPTHLDAWSYLAWNYHRHLKEPKLAQKAYKRALEINPKAYWVWNDWGSFNQEVTRNFRVAEEAFRKAIEYNDKPYCPSFNLGNLYQDFLNNLAEAEVCYRKSLESRPDYSCALMGLARLYHKQKLAEDVYAPLALQAVLAEPKNGFVLMQFCRLCGDSRNSLATILPKLSKWCANHPRHLHLPMTFSFTISMWVRLVSLDGVQAAAKLLSDIPDEDRLPFAPLEDALLAAQSESHLLLLAPERAELAANLLKMIHPTKRAALGTEK
jgi:Tfp pilus assembly protein PilF